ncbi:MAG TPA: DUF4097 family beta strand repeat-containing protein [Virgibacillus sp.]|nr:DUF4097 family beta strand repeat-containing protein [Virgibacillus sp.]
MNRKLILSLATVLVIVGVVGGLFTFDVDEMSVSKQKSFASEDIDWIDVNSSNMKVNVVSSESEDLTVELNGTESSRSHHDFAWDVDDRTLRIDVKDKNWHLFDFDSFLNSVTFTIAIPDEQFERLHVNSDNGYITVKGVEMNEMSLEADNGKIEGEDLKTSNFHVQASNGKLDLTNIDGNVTAKTNNGKINMRTHHLEKSIDLETNNGTITIHSEQEPENVTFLTSVNNGKVDLFGGKYNDSEVVGNGDHVVKLTANNGKIKVAH